MTKDEARKQVLKLWRALPPLERQSFAQAEAFALGLAPSIEFETMGNKSRVIVAWLQRDLLDIAAAVEAVRQQAAARQRPAPKAPASKAPTAKVPVPKIPVPKTPAE
ncbi:MAG: hypothetical protein BGO82_18275 [Devosia sp. 67-54]|uniref:hypothetical protein n=1 Tax=unclassified Devosia TaxID=196773 RepID=UPI00095BA88D|nr:MULTISPECIES: hypothetical protein [unclassified Devosia]MBN9304324.1 hypothetical protein [Devosia sp.]OJX18131.1 MAG: hypothetical protein BGO82_18275 [Devosia sp. 67-54]